MDETFTITLPADSDGYVPMRCPRCGEYFGVTPEGYNADDVFDLYCPRCGLQSERFFTDEVETLIQRVAENAAAGMVASQLKQLERDLSSELFKVTCEGVPKQKTPQSLVSHADMTPQVVCPCCGRKAKLGIELKVIGAICPYCGMEMHMEVTAKELKKICMEFKTRAGHAINGNCREVTVNLESFLKYVEQTPLIFEYVTSCKGSLDDDAIRERVYGDGVPYNSEIPLKQNVQREEEPWFYYQVLNCVRNDADKIFWIGNCYGGSGHYQDCTNAFGRFLVEPFVSVVCDYIRSLMIEMGVDEDVRFNISVQQGGQVNIAQNHSVINANLSNQISGFDQCVAELQKAAAQAGATAGQMSQIVDYLDAIRQGLSSNNLSKSKVSAFTTALKTIVEPMRNAQYLADIIAKIGTIIIQ